MNRILALTSLVFSACLAQPAQQTSPNRTKLEKVDRIMELTNSTAMIDTVLSQIRNSFASQLPQNATRQQIAAVETMTTKVADLIKARLEKIRPDIAKIYAETYSDEEIDSILAFYESPAGRALREKSPTVIEQSMKLMQAQMVELQPDIQRIVRESMQTR